MIYVNGFHWRRLLWPLFLATIPSALWRVCRIGKWFLSKCDGIFIFSLQPGLSDRRNVCFLRLYYFSLRKRLLLLKKTRHYLNGKWNLWHGIVFFLGFPHSGTGMKKNMFKEISSATMRGRDIQFVTALCTS